MLILNVICLDKFKNREYFKEEGNIYVLTFSIIRFFFYTLYLQTYKKICILHTNRLFICLY